MRKIHALREYVDAFEARAQAVGGAHPTNFELVRRAVGSFSQIRFSRGLEP
jgi:hypothetical protein